MDSGQRSAVDAVMDDVLAKYDQLLRLVAEGGLNGVEDDRFVGFLQRFEGARNRLLFVEGQAIAEARRRSLLSARL